MSGSFSDVYSSKCLFKISLINYRIFNLSIINQLHTSKLDKFPGTSVLSFGAKPGQAQESEVKITGKKSLKLLVGSGLARSSSLPKV